MLCGDNTANVLPEKAMEVNLQLLQTKIPKESVITSSESVFAYNKPPYRISVFKTGRLLIGNVTTEEGALQVARQVWNEIPS